MYQICDFPLWHHQGDTGQIRKHWEGEFCLIRGFWLKRVREKCFSRWKTKGWINKGRSIAHVFMQLTAWVCQEVIFVFILGHLGWFIVSAFKGQSWFYHSSPESGVFNPLYSLPFCWTIDAFDEGQKQCGRNGGWNIDNLADTSMAFDDVIKGWFTQHQCLKKRKANGLSWRFMGRWQTNIV